MEPTTKKRKLAPKVNASSTPNCSPAVPATAAAAAAAAVAATTGQHPNEPSLSQSQLYPAHDAPLSERQDFESFARHLQDAAMLIQRQTERPPYADVSVLLLSWEEDRSVDDDVAAFEQLLQDKYNYATQRWQIPTVPNPSIKLGVQMASFLENARPKHLLIIYYAGHGYVGVDGHVYWACNGREDAAKLKWDGVRCLFEDAQSDILLLLDSCATTDPPTAGSHGIKQGIAASTPEHGSREQGSHSFTANLIEALQKLHCGRPFSVNRLYEELVAQRQPQNAQVARTQTTNPGAPLQSRLPLLFTLTPGKSQHLTMAPLPSRRLTGPTQNGGEASEGQVARVREDQLIDPESAADIRFDEARVLVCTTFVGDASTDMSYFNQWLQDTPPLASKIAVEGMFLGPPTMLLISMPHSIWTVVQHDKVCCFLGYVSSHNMLHLYERLVGPTDVRPSAKEVEDGRILLEARELAAGTPARAAHRRDADEHHDHLFHSSATREHPGSLAQSSSSPATFSLGTQKPKNEVEDSAEMQEAAEQLKALSHVRHRSDEANNVAERARTNLPDGLSNETHRLPQDTSDVAVDDSAMLMDIKLTPNSKSKGPRRSVFKQEYRCNHCSHAPFKDSSSLRKHIAAAHTRPFPCAFSFAGCTSTFGSKNEWKRHIASQHLCLQYYRCSACPQTAAEGKGNEFNRKDLFTQHLRRMHAPLQIRRAVSQGDGQLQSNWDAQVKEMQQSCLVTRRQPPQRASCPKPDCRKEFDGASAWDEWTEHVGRHMEKGEGPVLGADGLLAQWALDEGIIELKGDGGYRLCAANGLLGTSQSSSGPVLDRKDSMTMSFATDSSQLEDTLMEDSKSGDGEVDASHVTAV
ncbi:Zinc finger, C2H2-like protein [Metarhizium album ARSEF 1941]|uniref:Zinc finger, C2H2-like protein n=1 Tax=Metarhizium album (strain ARSEF 1941) TaxID=1081103 RepID=A0A0B2WQE6_METAS|nr:Zinc finger, C2H2-like protein [Metarhizium album ARSEF 1941]KHN95215.1 Zinc finger, C2H2-like protein [Metarhizium album ARSEF 1941]